MKQKANLKIINLVTLGLLLCLSPISNISSQKTNGTAFQIEHFALEDGLTDARIYNTFLLPGKTLGIQTSSSIEFFNGTSFSHFLDLDLLGFFPSILHTSSCGKIIATKYSYEIGTSPIMNIKNSVIINPESKSITPFVSKSKLSDLTWLTNDSQGNVLLSFHGNKHFIEENDSLRLISDFPSEITSLIEYHEDFILGNTTGGILLFDRKSNNAKTLIDSCYLYIAIHNSISNQTFFKTRKNHQDWIEHRYYIFDHNSNDLLQIEDMSLHKPHPLLLFNESKLGTTRNSADRKRNFMQFLEEISPEDYTTDKNDNLWISSYYGLYKLALDKSLFGKSIFQKGLSFKNIYQYENKIIGSTFFGPVEIDLTSSEIKKIETNQYVINTANILTDQQNYLFTTLGELEILDAKNRPIYTKEIYEKKEEEYNVNLMEQKSKSKILLINAKTGIASYDINSREVTFKKNVFADAETKLLGSHLENELFVCSSAGLYVIDTSSFDYWLLNQYGQSHAISSKDKGAETYWHATEKGLFILDLKNKTSTIFHSFNSSEERTITKIIVHNEYLILPSYNGLLLLNTLTKEVKRFTTYDGLPNNEFNFLSSLTLNNGDIALGTISGLAIFSPDELCGDFDGKKVDIELTNEIDNPHTYSKTGTLHEIDSLREIRFHSNLVSKRLEFRHPDYKSIKGKKLRYCVSEKDGTFINWRTNDKLSLEISRRDYGEYQLKVEVLDQGENMLTSKDFTLMFERPFTRSFLFYALVGLFFSLISLSVIRYQRRRLLVKNLKLEQLVDERSSQLKAQNEKLSAIRKSQNYLFGVIAHDMRAPLQTMRNLSEKVSYLLAKKDPERIKEISSQIETKVSYLSKTVDDLLEWSKLETNVQSMIITDCELANVMNDLALFYSTALVNKQLLIEHDIENGITVPFDENALLTIMRNLVGNAIKFSQEKSTIYIKSRLSEDFIDIDVINFGLTFTKSAFEAIIDRKAFKSIQGTDGEVGFGLGLQIIYHYLKIMGGSFSLTQESQPTILTIRILNPKQL